MAALIAAALGAIAINTATTLSLLSPALNFQVHGEPFPDKICARLVICWSTGSSPTCWFRSHVLGWTQHAKSSTAGSCMCGPRLGAPVP